MAYSDTNYVFLAGGCNTTLNAGANNLYGSVSALSSLNPKEVVLILVSASGGDARLSLDPKTGATNDTPLRLFTSASTFDLPPMTIANASQISWARDGASGNNPVIFWYAMGRAPL